MISYRNGPIVLTSNEKETLRQLEHTKRVGGKYLYVIKSLGSEPYYYSVYTEAKTKIERQFVANVYGEIVTCLNWILHDELAVGATVFEIEEILNKYCN